MSKPWRDAATLIIIARDVSKSSKFDYKVLTFKRTEKTSFFANSLAFPGGGIDKTDESLSWVNFFKHHKLPSEELRKSPTVKKPFIYEPQSNKIEREISLRLTAIRETFEELGIVFCSKPSETSKSAFSTFYHEKDLDIPLWQKEIHGHKETLMSFCDKHDLVPNIFNLYEWSVWLTPTFYPKRYETAFFLVALNNVPPCYAESNEVQDYSWHTPEDLLKMHKEKTVWLPPPQYFEISRLKNYYSIDLIAEFAKKRNGQDVPLILPINYTLKSSMAMVYPNDDLYPDNISPYEINHDVDKFQDKTYEELAAMSKNLCRIEIKDMIAKNFLCNISDGLLSPKTENVKSNL